MPEPHAAVAVIGGSGFYEILADARGVEVATPYGAPSARHTDRPKDLPGAVVSDLPHTGEGFAGASWADDIDLPDELP